MSEPSLDQIDDLLTETPTGGGGEVMDQVEDLLAGKELPSPEGGEAAEPTGDSETDEEAPEVEIPDGVDYEQEVTMSDGSKLTLGALKDAYQNQQTQTLEIQERENAVMAQMAEMQELSQYTQLPPDKVAMIRQRQEQYMAEQHGLMLTAIPAFKDQAVFAEAKKGIEGLAAEYGIQDTVAKVTDHRVVKLLHDFATLRQGIRAAKDNVKPLRSSDPKAHSKPAGKINAATAAAQLAAKTGSKGDQMAAIDALLN